MTLVVDSSFVVAALTDRGPDGQWAESLIAVEPLAAPHLMQAEVANILRRSAMAGDLSVAEAGLAHSDLLRLRVELFAYAAFASRTWQLRENVTVYDAWYVGIAEGIGAPLATLDLRLAAASGPTCRFLTPPGSLSSCSESGG